MKHPGQGLGKGRTQTWKSVKLKRKLVWGAQRSFRPNPICFSSQLTQHGALAFRDTE